MKKQIIFMRHACTEYHEKKRVLGITDIPLNNKGIEMVSACVDNLRKYKIEKVVTSNLTRAYQTGNIISEALNIPICIMPNIDERNQGILEGLTFNEIEKRFGRIDGISKIEGREELKTFIDRVKNGIEYICEINKEDTILVVSHCNVLQTFFQVHGIRVRKWELCSTRVGYYYGKGEWSFEK